MTRVGGTIITTESMSKWAETTKELRRKRLGVARTRCYREMVKVRKLVEAGKLTREEGDESLRRIKIWMRDLKQEVING